MIASELARYVLTMTNLDDKFVEKARQAPTRLEHGTTVVLFRGSDVIALVGSAGVIAELEVILDGETAGYITKQLDGTHGSVRSGDFGITRAETYRTLEGALEFMLPGAADRVTEKPESQST